MPLWLAEERNDFWERNCFDNKCRTLKVKIYNTTNNNKDPTCLVLEKPFMCNCFNCPKPFLNVFYTEEQPGP